MTAWVDKRLAEHMLEFALRRQVGLMQLTSKFRHRKTVR